MELLAKMGAAAGNLPSVPGADCLLLSVGSAQVLWAWIWCNGSLTAL
jgi:hypothetical protein